MRTLVYGLGESGIAATRALLEHGEDVLVADSGDGESLEATLEKLGVEGVPGATPAVLDGVDRIVVSPGISPKDEILRTAGERQIPVISEVALGLELLGGERRGVRVVAMTGTNGKTTAIDMLCSILEASRVRHAVAGNSWRALTGCLDEVAEAGVLALEVSSFQLHYLRDAGFEVAALLNVRPDHLNWHASYEEYVRDKLRVFAGQDARDLALVSASDPVGREATPTLTARAEVVGAGETALREGVLLLRGEEVATEDELPFVGAHNHENALFAAASAMELGASLAGIREGLLGCKVKPHRLEVVAERGGVLWVDDSKATNPAATAAALGSFRRPVVLILGGSEKDTDFAEILPLLGNCRAVICQGEAGPRIFEYLDREGFGDISRLVEDLAAAVREADIVAREGDAVLLSPGCASFDQFAGYAERGKAFALLARDAGASAGAKDRRAVGG